MFLNSNLNKTFQFLLYMVSDVLELANRFYPWSYDKWIDWFYNNTFFNGY